MNLDMIVAKTKTEDLLLSPTEKNVKRLFAKPIQIYKKHWDFHLPNPGKFSHSNHLLILVLFVIGWLV